MRRSIWCEVRLLRAVGRRPPPTCPPALTPYFDGSGRRVPPCPAPPAPFCRSGSCVATPVGQWLCGSSRLDAADGEHKAAPSSPHRRRAPARWRCRTR
ncbi:hypothetical protein M8494_17790 [Serratia ureilytica]